MALRAVAHLARRAVARGVVAARPAPVSVSLRAMSGDHNPFTHSLDLINEDKKASEIDLGDGKKQVVYERIKVEPPPEHAPPAKLSGPIGKIASNVFFYASENGVLDAVEKDFLVIQDMLLDSEAWMESSGWTTEEKMALIDGFIKEPTIHLSDFTKQLLPYFVEEKMIKDLPEIADLFLYLMREKRGEIDVFVTSAEPLAPETLKELEGLIVKQIGSTGATKVNFQTEVDKTLIAGLRIQYKSTLIDNTIARKLAATKDTWAKTYQEEFAL